MTFKARSQPEPLHSERVRMLFNGRELVAAAEKLSKAIRQHSEALSLVRDPVIGEALREVEALVDRIKGPDL